MDNFTITDEITKDEETRSTTAHGHSLNSLEARCFTETIINSSVNRSTRHLLDLALLSDWISSLSKRPEVVSTLLTISAPIISYTWYLIPSLE